MNIIVIVKVPIHAQKVSDISCKFLCS